MTIIRSQTAARPGAEGTLRGTTAPLPGLRPGNGAQTQRFTVPFFRTVFVHWLAVLVTGAILAGADEITRGPRSGTEAIVLLEAAGRVEVRSTNEVWVVARPGLHLAPGDRVRTLLHSRAAVQLSDRSVLRLDEQTTLEILKPRNSEKRRFGLPSGSLYFFNREKPSEVEFDTPLADGAIRGTEFLLEVTEASTALHLAMIDGRVELKTGSGDVSLIRGQELRLVPNAPPRTTTLVDAIVGIQWALYYPGVLCPGDIRLTPEQKAQLADVLQLYESGDWLGALTAWPTNIGEDNPGPRILRAQLDLAVGRADEADRLLGEDISPGARALRQLIHVVRGEPAMPASDSGSGASGAMATSYALQSRGNLEDALAAARTAAALEPETGFVQARVGELEFSLGNRREALHALQTALTLSPRLATAYVLQGFVLLDIGKVQAALNAFDDARAMDAGIGAAWLGRGLCLMHQGLLTSARASFQAAAALEPQRALHRSYLGKIASDLGDSKAADKEFRLAKAMDATDPTAWFYSALHLQQENRLNESVIDLERALDMNDRRSVFRSRLLLDEDRSVRSADLSAVYAEGGLSDVGLRTAQRAVSESYSSFSGHLFLANAYQKLTESTPFDLRLETARQTELIVANLLSPPGAGNLSILLSQSDRLRFFQQAPLGASSLTVYDSRGLWQESATVFGTEGGFSYALDAFYQTSPGQRVNNDSSLREIALTLKERISPDDDAYLQVGGLQSRSGDISALYHPESATTGLRTAEDQAPNLYGGWRHSWSPESTTLILVSRLDDHFTLLDPQSDQLFLFNNSRGIQSIQSPPTGPPFIHDFSSRTVVVSADLQQVFETHHHSLIIGGRLQDGTVTTQSTLSRALTGIVTGSEQQGELKRMDAYGYYTWHPVAALRLTGGATFSHLDFPENTEFAPISLHSTTQNQAAPKAGVIFTPWQRGTLHAAYSQSLGGLFFDNSIRLEPTHIGGFNQAFRSLIPESVAGLIPGAGFQSIGVGFDQSFASGTFFGSEAVQLNSEGFRSVGILTNSTFLPIPDAPGKTTQHLQFRERNISAFAGQLLGEWFSAGVRFRTSTATLVGRFPDLHPATVGLGRLQQDDEANLDQVSLSLNFNHSSGVFAQWESLWTHQESSGYNPPLAKSDFWQHSMMVGYRFPRRRAEVRLGILNMADTDFRLNPLNLHADLPRTRTLTASLRLNF